jgi:outer membrane protein assembly factor BamB
MAADWPQYRGPNLDGTSPETIRTNWDVNPPKEIWRKAIEPGWSSVAVVGDRLYTQVRRAANDEQREFCIALDAATGAEIWATDVGSGVYTDLSGYSDQIDGPRSTPTIDGDRVYIFSSYLQLYCLRADNGQQIWKRDFGSEFGAGVIPWENAASPLLVGELIYVNSNAPGQCLMAIRKSDGTIAWSGQSFSMTHASPIYGTVAGAPQVIFLTHSGLVAVAPLTGSVLWRLPFSPSSTSTASSPVIVNDYVWASAAYASGMWMAHVTHENDVFTAQQTRYQQGVFYQSHWATPVEYQGNLYCVPSPSPDQGRLACLDPVGASNRWIQQIVGTGNISFGSVIRASDTLIVLTESGELVLVQPDITSYIELAKYKVLTQYCWNHPTLSNGRLYVRNSAISSELVALDVKASLPPLPAFGLQVAGLTNNTSLRVSAYSEANEIFHEADAPRLEVLTSTNIAAPLSTWLPLPDAFTFLDGGLYMEIPTTNAAGLFLRVHDKEAAP